MLRRTPQMEGLGRRLTGAPGRLIELGTSPYPPKTRRRLKSINVGSFTIAVSCALFALTYAMEDFALYRGAVAVNLAMMAAALSVPAFHRINDMAAGVFIAAALLLGLFVLVALMGRLSGIQINFIATSALAFLIFGLRRMLFIAVAIGVAITLHIAAWLLFPEGLIGEGVTAGFLTQIYVTIVVTISIIVAVVVYYAFWTAEQAEAETESLLGRILPASVVERLKLRPGEPIADSFAEAAVLFSDLAGFVPLARQLGAARTVAMLNHMVHSFDRLAATHRVEKIKTIGDAYMAVAGLPEPQPDDAARLARMALRMQAAADETARAFGVDLRLRIGIALGPVMAGIIGRDRFGYDVWGDPVNLAARLESTGEPGRIQVSGAFRERLGDDFAFAYRGSIDIRGVGAADTFFLVGPARGASDRAGGG
ncbi:MAG TPA: adenylate/guanylate cyclase domain-containing protein [Propylenella sp.]